MLNYTKLLLISEKPSGKGEQYISMSNYFNINISCKIEQTLRSLSDICSHILSMKGRHCKEKRACYTAFEK